ncbi:MAG: hypothetical protein WCJ25_03110 [Candidatus Moraniibacteriota bacterium]
MKTAQPMRSAMISVAKGLLQKADAKPLKEPLIGAWRNDSGLSLFVFPEKMKVEIKTQVSIASFSFESENYVVILGSN